MGGEGAGEETFGAGVLMGGEVRLGEPERVVRIVYKVLYSKHWGIAIQTNHTLVHETILSPQNAAVSYRCCMSASCRHNLILSTIPHSISSSSSSSSESPNTFVSLARGCLLALSLTRRRPWGDARRGDVANMDRFGSRLSGSGWSAVDEFASSKELTSDCGPKEKDEFMDERGWREWDGEGRRGIGGMA